MKNHTLKLTAMICSIIIFCFNAQALQKYGTPAIHDSIPECLTVKGKISAYGQSVVGASIVLYKGNTEVERLEKNPSRKFEFVLQKNAVYTIVISKKGLVDRVIRFETYLPAKAQPSSTDELYNFTFEVMMVKEEEITSPTFMDFPVAVVRYYERHKSFDYSKTYTKNIKQETGQVSGTK